MPTSSVPTIRSLTRAECDALLARNHVGRLAFSFHDRVDIQPINYVYEAGWLFGRTSEGTKLLMLDHNHWLAFEVDEVRGPFDWGSVVVQGTFHRIDPEGPPRDRAAGAHAVRLLRDLVPGTFDATDPAPFRTVLFRISIGEMRGRAAAPPPGRAASAPAEIEVPRPARATPSDRSGW